MNQLVFQKDKLGIGRRKQAVARVFLTPGTGNIRINSVSGEKYADATHSLNHPLSPPPPSSKHFLLKSSPKFTSHQF